MEEEKKGFKVKDRRIFTESGSAREDEEKGPVAAAGQEPPEAVTAEEAVTGRPSEEGEDFPPVNFAGFILSLSTTAMFHFGDFPDPATQKAVVNLPAAKQTIDIMGILQEKTRGNLDAEEKQLLDSILFELRMRFVKETNRS
jgi:hypothetical protein